MHRRQPRVTLRSAKEAQTTSLVTDVIAENQSLLGAAHSRRVPWTSCLFVTLLTLRLVPTAHAQWVPGLPSGGAEETPSSPPVRPAPPPSRPEPEPPTPPPEPAAGPESTTPDASPPPETAAEFYRRGREHFEAERYREAAADLERARQLDPDSPNLVYNTARAYELAGDHERALVHYHAYRALLTESQVTERSETDARITQLNEAIETSESPTASSEGSEAHTPPTTGFLEPDSFEESGSSNPTDVWFWAAAATSVASLAAATALGILALGERSELDDYVVGMSNTCITVDRCADPWDGRANSVRSLSIASDVLFAVSAGAGLATLLLYLLRAENADEAEDEYEPVDTLFAAGSDFVIAGGTARW